MDLHPQLAQPQRAKELCGHLSSLVSNDACSIMIFTDGKGSYFGVSGGVSSPTELHFGNQELRRETKNPTAYSSVLLDVGENSNLRPEERAFLNDITGRFRPETGTIEGFQIVGKLTKPLDGSTVLEGAIPVGLPFSINNEDAYALILEHISGLEKVHNYKRSSDVTFYSQGDHPYARVSVDVSIPQSVSGLEFQQPGRLSVIFDLHAGDMAGYELMIDGKPVSVALPPTGELFQRIEGVLLSRLAELSPSPDQQGERGWIPLAAPQEGETLAFSAKLLRNSAENLATQIEGISAFLEPHLHHTMSEFSPHYNAPYASMPLGQFGARMIKAVARQSGILSEEEVGKLPLSVSELTSRVAATLRDPSAPVTREQINQVREVFQVIKIEAFKLPETYSDRYPALVAEFRAWRNGKPAMECRSGEVFDNVMEALRSGDLSYIMVAEQHPSLRLRVTADGVEYGVDLAVGDTYGHLNYALLRNGEKKEFSFDNEEAQVFSQITGMLAQEIDSQWDLSEQLGFPLNEVWKAWEDQRFEDLQNIPYSLLRAQGYRPSLRAGTPHLAHAPESVTPEVQRFNEMLIAGIQKIHEIGHVIVNWHSMSDHQQMGSYPDAYGPMSKERFAELYPNGIIGNNLLFAPRHVVGDASYPPEFYAVPFYLKRLGFSYNEESKEWQA